MAPSLLLFGFGFSNRGKGLPNSTRAMNICHGVLLEVRIRQETAPNSRQSILSNGTVQDFRRIRRRRAPLWTTQPLTLKESSAPKSTTTSQKCITTASMLNLLPWSSVIFHDVVPWCSVATSRRWTEHDSQQKLSHFHEYCMRNGWFPPEHLHRFHLSQKSGSTWFNNPYLHFGSCWIVGCCRCLTGTEVRRYPSGVANETTSSFPFH